MLPAASSSSVRRDYLTATSSADCQVWLDGRKIGSSSGWRQPVEGFEPAIRGGTNTLLILCARANAPRQAPGVIAGVCTLDGAVITTADPSWRVAALTPSEADSGYADIIRRGDWRSPGRFPVTRIPSRENRASVLEDLPPQWLTGQTSEERPFLVFKLDWFE